MTSQILALRDHLIGERITYAVMEAEQQPVHPTAARAAVAGERYRLPVSPRAVRSATAMSVLVGFWQPEVTNTLPSAT
jgi:hypothetical protein